MMAAEPSPAARRRDPVRLTHSTTTLASSAPATIP
jgi:hypothetical protein